MGIHPDMQNRLATGVRCCWSELELHAGGFWMQLLTGGHKGCYISSFTYSFSFFFSLSFLQKWF